VDPNNFDEHIKHIIKALKTQNHNNDRVKPSRHLSNLVDYIFLYLWLDECKGRGASCAENEAKNVEFWWSIPLLIELMMMKWS
jgi:hypothetical protein